VVHLRDSSGLRLFDGNGEKAGTFYGQPMTAGDIYTIAGTGTSGLSGDGGSAAGAEVAIPKESRWTAQATW